MNKNKIQTISCLVLFLLVFNLPSLAKDRYVILERNMWGRPIGEGLDGLSDELGKFGTGLRKKKLEEKQRDYIKTCNDPLLDALEPEEAMKLIIEKGIKCPGNKITNKGKK